MALQLLHLAAGVLAALLALRALSARYGGRRSRLPLPPGPRGRPLLGNLAQVPLHQPWIQYHAWSRDPGVGGGSPVLYLDVATQPVVVLDGATAAHDLLSRRGALYSGRARSVVSGEMGSGGLNILLRQYDRDYLLHQRMEAPLLVARAAAAYRPLQELESRQLLFDLLTSADGAGGGEGEGEGEGGGIDCDHWFDRMTASIIYALNYGMRFRTGHEQVLRHAQYVQGEAVKNILMGAHLVDLFPVLNHLPAFLAPWKKTGRDLWQLERSLHVGNMERGFANPGWNFAKYFRDSKEGRNMSPEELAFDLGVLADAALDTSTMTLSWFVVACLTGDGAFVAKAQRLLDEVVGKDRLPQFEDMPQLAYIQAIVHETMRWRPVVGGGVPHKYCGDKDDEYLGYRIPAGSLVLANHWGIGRDESVYGPDVEDFIPERWLPAQGDKTSKTIPGIRDLYTPGFGYGRRVCTGQHIARNQLFIAVARLLWAFDVGPATTAWGAPAVIDPLASTAGFSVRPLPYKAVFRPRGPWVRDLIMQHCDTHGADLAEILNQAGLDRGAKT